MKSAVNEAETTVRMATCGSLTDPERLRALAESGLTARPDAIMDGIAQRVQQRLGVPVALVSLVQAERQVFPGMVGLPAPFAGSRATPLSHSFCQHVVETAQPLVIADARTHPLVRRNLAVVDLGVVAYAGMPLTDGGGLVLGSLCLALFMVMLDGTVVNTALPRIQSDLGTGVSGLQWIVDGYVLALAALMLTGGASCCSAGWPSSPSARSCAGWPPPPGR